MNKINHYAVITFLMLIMALGAQAFTVKNLSADPMDISAVRNKRTSDGITASLIKVALPLPGCEFFGNTVGDVNYINGEYWVYLEPNSISLIVLSKEGEETTVDFNKFGLTQLESSATYKMECELTTKEKNDLLGDIPDGDSRTEYNIPKHLSKAFKKKGEIYYMTQDECLQQPNDYFFFVEPVGIVIEYNNKIFLFLSQYVKDENGEECQFTYSEALEYIKENPELRMLTFDEAQYFLFNVDDIEKAASIEDLGLTKSLFIGGFPLAETWIYDENYPDRTFLSTDYLKCIGNIDEPTKKRRLRVVKDIKQ